MELPGSFAAVLLVLSTLGLAEALFVPEELPTLLSFLYTNIPPVFKGTDSRLGIGFRVGPNADFQMQFEVGPQTRTQPLGPDSEGSSKKRHVPKHEAPPKVPRPVMVMKVPATPQDWLHGWKASVGSLSQEDEEPLITQPVIDYNTVRHLQQLYQQQPMESNDVR